MIFLGIGILTLVAIIICLCMLHSRHNKQVIKESKMAALKRLIVQREQAQSEEAMMTIHEEIKKIHDSLSKRRKKLV